VGSFQNCAVKPHRLDGEIRLQDNPENGVNFRGESGRCTERDFNLCPSDEILTVTASSPLRNGSL
jgi:hypothetical protein